MNIQFDDQGIGPIIGSEYAQISVTFDAEANAPRLRLEDPRTGRVRFLDALELETNEAFAVQVLAVLSGWGIKLQDVEDRLNVNGSGISLGHPIGATGARILTTMLHELRRRGGGLALETTCIGGGQGIAAVFRGAA